jgi:hypothetical protein
MNSATITELLLFREAYAEHILGKIMGLNHLDHGLNDAIKIAAFAFGCLDRNDYTAMWEETKDNWDKDQWFFVRCYIDDLMLKTS